MRVAAYPFQASSHDERLLTDRLGVERGWATTTPSPPSLPEEGSVVRRSVRPGVEVVQKRAGNMLLGSSASKLTYSTRNMHWRSLAGTVGGVVGGMEGAGVVPTMTTL